MADFTVASGAQIGFTANKTEADAQKITTSDATFGNRMVITKEKKLYMNGSRLGLSDAEATWITNKIKSDNQSTVDSKFSIQLTATPSLYEKNGVYFVKQSPDNPKDKYVKGVNVSFKAVFTYNSTNVQAATVSASAPSTPIYASTISITNGNATLTLTWNKIEKCYRLTTQTPVVGTWTVKGCAFATDMNFLTSPKSATVGVSAYDYVYYGVSTRDSIGNSNIITGFKDGASGAMYTGSSGNNVLFTALSSLKASAAGSYSFNIPANGYAYILIPQGVAKGTFASADSDGIYHASEGVSDVPFVKLDNLVTSLLTSSITTTNPITPLVSKGITFEVFRLASAQNAGTHNFTI